MADVEHEPEDRVASDSNHPERDQPDGPTPPDDVNDVPVPGDGHVSADQDAVPEDVPSPESGESVSDQDVSASDDTSPPGPDGEPETKVSGDPVQPEIDRPEPAASRDEDVSGEPEAEPRDTMEDMSSLLAELEADVSVEDETGEVSEPSDVPSEEALPDEVPASTEDEASEETSRVEREVPHRADDENLMDDPLYAAMVKKDSSGAEPADAEPAAGVDVTRPADEIEPAVEAPAESEPEPEAPAEREGEPGEVPAEPEVEPEAPAEPEGEPGEVPAEPEVEPEAPTEPEGEPGEVPAEPEVEAEGPPTEAEGEPRVPPAEPEGQVPVERVGIELPLGRRLRTVILHPRVLAAVLAGVVAGLAAYRVLSTHVARPPESLLAELVDRKSLAEICTMARSLADEGATGQALALLDRAIERSRPSAEKSEMLYLAAELDDDLAGTAPDGGTLERLRLRYEKALAEDRNNPHTPTALDRLGTIYMAQRNFGAARERLDEIVARFPDYADLDDVNISIAESHYLENSYRVAEKMLVRMLSTGLAPEDLTRAQMLLGRVLEDSGKVASAEKIYTRMADEHAGTEHAAAATERLAYIAGARGDHARAARLFEKLLGETIDVSSNDRLVLELAKAYYAQKDYGRADSRCRDLMELWPESQHAPTAAALLSSTLAARERFAEAEQVALEAMSRFPKNARVVEALADLCFDREDYDNARTYYATALGLDSSRLNARFRLGQSAMELEQFGTAIHAFSIVAHTEPVRGRLQYEAHLRLADAYVAAGRADQAVDSLLGYLAKFQTSERRRPILRHLAKVYDGLALHAQAAGVYEQIAGSSTTDHALIDAADAYMAAGKRARARLLLQRADIEKMPPVTAYTALVMKARLSRAIGDLQGATAQLATAHTRYPEARSSAGMTMLLEAYLADDKEASARALVKDARQWAETNGSLGLFMSELYVRWGDYLFGRADYKGAAEVFSEIAADANVPVESRSWAQYQYANCIFNLERYREAEDLYRRFVDEHKQSPWSKGAATRIAFSAVERRLRGAG